MGEESKRGGMGENRAKRRGKKERWERMGEEGMEERWGIRKRGEVREEG